MPIHQLDDIVPVLADRVFIAPDAHVIGRVSLGPDVGIWFGAVLRGDNEMMRVGARTNIQDGCVLHSDWGFSLTIGEDCTVGHRAIVHGCTIGNGSLIGMGATVLNGAVIGSGCIVGANALVTEGKVFADGSLIVGAPARAVRTLDAEAREKLLASAAHYVANAKRFSAGLKTPG